LPVIEIENLTKSYGKTLAISDVDLTVEEGDVFGFIGPNGAGKTTTLRILLGLLRKDAGHVSVLGGDPWRDAVALHRRLAYVPGDVSLWPNLSGGEVIDLLGRLRGGFDQSHRDELMERFAFDPTKPCRTYSTGNRQKVALIAAFVCEVELFILDEPTLGLDPLMEAVFRDCVAEAKESGKTVLLSSHILAEVEALCDRISIIKEGRIVDSGTLAELRHLRRISMSVDSAYPVSGLNELSGVHDVRVDGLHAHFSVEEWAINRVLEYLTRFDVHALTSAPPTLEDLFLRHYELETEGAAR
jgi:ABC-2 type transport system ATP-binding protein